MIRRAILYWSDNDHAFIAEAPDLPGCAADGPTMPQALAALEHIADQWRETARSLGRDTPEPPPPCH